MKLKKNEYLLSYLINDNVQKSKFHRYFYQSTGLKPNVKYIEANKRKGEFIVVTLQDINKYNYEITHINKLVDSIKEKMKKIKENEKYLPFYD